MIAKELGEGGLTVIVLEAGRRYRPYHDYPTDAADFEVRSQNVFLPADARRDIYTTPADKPFHYSRVKGVGGCTLVYHAMCPRFHESDFRVRSEDGVADDWPISYADLEPYYTKVEYELGVSGPDGAAASPFEPYRSRPYPTPAHEFNLASRRIKRGPRSWDCTWSGSRSRSQQPIGMATQELLNAGRATCIARFRQAEGIDVHIHSKTEKTKKVQMVVRSVWPEKSRLRPMAARGAWSTSTPMAE